MKRVLTILLCFLGISFLSSCTKEDSNTYTIKCSLSVVDGVAIDIIAFEYNSSNEIVGQNQMKRISQGTTKTFTANSRAEKVKIYLTLSLTSSSSSSPTHLWVQQVYYLEKGKDTVIEIFDSTITGKTEP